MSAPISNKSTSKYVDNKFADVYAQCMNESISNIITDIRNRITEMKFTATELSRNPNKVFRAAYDAKGEPVTIVHGQYSEGFEIRLKQSEHAINSNDAHKDKAVEIGLRMLEKGNVIITGGGKYVIKTPRILEPAIHYRFPLIADCAKAAKWVENSRTV